MSCRDLRASTHTSKAITHSWVVDCSVDAGETCRVGDVARSLVLAYLREGTQRSSHRHALRPVVAVELGGDDACGRHALFDPALLPHTLIGKDLENTYGRQCRHTRILKSRCWYERAPNTIVLKAGAPSTPRFAEWTFKLDNSHWRSE